MPKKTIIQTSAAPSAIGAFSQAVGYGGLVGGGIEAQTRQCMENARAILDASGLGLGHVVRATIYLKNMADYHAVNAIYGGFFDENPPARTCVEVSRLPKDALIEIEVLAAAPAQAEDTEPAPMPAPEIQPDALPLDPAAEDAVEVALEKKLDESA